MRSSPYRSFRALALCAALAAVCLLHARAADQLVWRMAQDRVDVEIDGWDLPKLLEQISAATGWQIFFEPGTTLNRPVTARFKNIRSGDALNRLLGDLSYALLPGENGPSRLMVFKTTLDNATKKVPAAGKKPGKAIPNELVVMLKPGAESSIEEIAAKFGAKIIGRSDSLKAYRLQLSDESSARSARDSMLDSPDLSMVDYNYPLDKTPQPRTANPSSIAPELTLKAGPLPDSGRVIIGLIDTALQPTGGPYDQFLLPSISVAGDSKLSDASPSHGTSMLETLLKGIAQVQGSSGETSARILPVDVYGNNETTTTFDVALGIKKAIESGANPINLSLGSSGDSQILHSVISQGFAKGVAFIAAAGNEPTTTPTYPAAYPEVLAVTAGNPSTGQVASYANYGSFVDVIAPGTALVTYNGRSYIVTGTSASTAYASGYVAGISATTGQSPIKSAQSLVSILGTSTPKK